MKLSSVWGLIEAVGVSMQQKLMVLEREYLNGQGVKSRGRIENLQRAIKVLMPLHSSGKADWARKRK